MAIAIKQGIAAITLAREWDRNRIEKNRNQSWNRGTQYPPNDQHDRRWLTLRLCLSVAYISGRIMEFVVIFIRLSLSPCRFPSLYGRPVCESWLYICVVSLVKGGQTLEGSLMSSCLENMVKDSLGPSMPTPRLGDIHVVAITNVSVAHSSPPACRC